MPFQPAMDRRMTRALASFDQVERPAEPDMTPADDADPIGPAAGWLMAAALLVIGGVCGWVLHACWIGGAA